MPYFITPVVVSAQARCVQVMLTVINRQNAAEATVISSTAQSDHKKEKDVALGYVCWQGKTFGFVYTTMLHQALRYKIIVFINYNEYQ